MRTHPIYFNNFIKFALMLALLISLWWLVQPALVATTIHASTNDYQLFSPHAQCSTHITVTSNGDSGPSTLRQALIDICNGGTVDFDATLANDTITISSQLNISRTVTITNPNAPNLKISGNNAVGVFTIQPGSVVKMNNLIITEGYDYWGAIRNEGELILTSNVITGNIGSGGGIKNYGRLTIIDGLISNNRGYNGGSIQNVGVLTITNSRIVNNVCVNGGGGIRNDGVMTLTNSIVSGNSGSSHTQGGGINNQGGIARIINVTISNNTALNGGGGILNVATLSVENSTISGNSAGDDVGGGYRGFSNSTTTFFKNSIIAGNTAGSSNDCYGRLTSQGYNLIQDTTGCAIVGNTTGNIIGQDPLLGPLQDNGGSTFTHALLPGSPAINAGDNTACLTTDQRGIDRPQQGQCDIGAFESQGFTLAVSGGNNQATPIASVFNYPLEVAVTSNSGAEPVDGGIVTFVAPDSGPSTTFAPTTTVTITSGVASLDATANTFVGGPYNVVASANGSNTVNFSLSNTKIMPTVVVNSSANPSTLGQTVNFVATVSSNGITPNGTIIFTIDGIPQTPINLINGQATYSTASLTVGSHTVSADYSGDDNFFASNGSLTNGQVVKATSTTSVGPSLNPSLIGRTVTFTATVSSSIGTPSGNVTFVIDGTPQSTVTLINGQATFSTASLTLGNHTVTVNYNGDTNLDGSSGTLAGGQLVYNNAPYIPSNPIPINASTNITTTQTLSWHGGDPDGDVVAYTIAFGSNNPPSIVETTNLTSYIPSLISGTTYYWIVTATDGISESTGPMWSFTTEVATTTDTGIVYLPIVLK